ncbi:MAG: hypothetical protein KHZ62_02525 [Clostridiales bacterium]|nr:hypothetical protein [Clostridiales bacterium]
MKRWILVLITGAIAAGLNMTALGGEERESLPVYEREEKMTETITKEALAVQLVRALGYEALAEEFQNVRLPYDDVSQNKGYLLIANDLGLIKEEDADTFAPQKELTPEEVDTAFRLCQEKLESKTEFLHGFYAFSSYSQKELAGTMDAVSLGWSRMECTDQGEVTVNTLSKNGNEWYVPDGYEEIISYLKERGVKTNLNIFLSDGDGTGKRLLNNAETREKAVERIVEEVSVSYQKLGCNPYDGVTIDFENLKGQAMAENFNLFLSSLKEKLDELGKSLYVCVQPRLKSGESFDGYDYETIGQIADKVIVMAYDYFPSTIPLEVMDSGFTTTPVTPFDEVYFGLKAVTDPKTGVKDRGKLVLGLGLTNVGWSTVDGKVINSRGLSYSYDKLEQLISNGAEVKYSEKYKNPYMILSEGEKQTVIWYENAKSMEEKIRLARLFDIDGTSVWRLGLIPEPLWDEMKK